MYYHKSKPTCRLLHIFIYCFSIQFNLANVLSELLVATPKKESFHEPRFVGDIRFQDVATPERAMKTLSLAKEVITKKNLQIKRLQQKNRRLVKKLTLCRELVEHLRDGDVVTYDVRQSLLKCLGHSTSVS